MKKALKYESDLLAISGNLIEKEEDIKFLQIITT